MNDEEVCQALVSMWARIGVKAKLNAMPFATFIPKILKHDTNAYLLGWGVATYDALYSLQSLVRTKTTGADGNFNLGRVSNAKLDQMIDAARIETDVAKRDAMLRDALKMTADEALYVPIHHQMRPWAMKKNITTSHRSDDRPEARFARID